MAFRDWYCEDVLSGKIEVEKVWENERVLDDESLRNEKCCSVFDC